MSFSAKRPVLRRLRALLSLSTVMTLALLAILTGFVLLERAGINGNVDELSRKRALTTAARELSLYVQYNAHDLDAYTLGHLDHRQRYVEHGEQFKRLIREIEPGLAAGSPDARTGALLERVRLARDRYERAADLLLQAIDRNRRGRTAEHQAREDAAWATTDKLAGELDLRSQALARGIGAQARALRTHIESRNRQIIRVVIALALLIGVLIVLIQAALNRARAAAESARRKSERLLIENTSILDGAGERNYELDRDGKTTFANPAAARMTGHEVDELLGRSLEIVHDSRPDGMPYPIEECDAFPSVRDATFHRSDHDTYWRKDGTSFPVEYTSTPIGADAEATGAVVIFRDITDRKRAEDALADGERRTRKILETAPDAFISIDERGLIRDSNAQAQAMFGWDSGEMLGREMAELIPAAGREAYRRRLAAHLAAGDGSELRTRLELMVLGRDGRQFPVERTMSAFKAEDGWVFNAFLRDISERKATEELHERQHRQLVEAQALGRFGSWEWDLGTNKIEWSDELRRICGLEPGVDEMTIEDGLRYVHAHDADAVRAELAAAFESSEPFSFEHRLVREDGAVRVVHARGYVIRGEDGAALRMLGTEQDITERHAVERAKDEFTSVVSHELRTPLTSIRGSLGLLESGVLGPLPEQGQRMVEIAVQNTDRLVRLINDILDIERMDSAASNMHQELCDAEELIERAAQSLAQLAMDAQVSLTVEGEPLALVADPDRMQQTLTNLISNAVKFSPPGGIVRISCKRRDGEVLFEVADEGRGIPADKLESIFGRFQQVDASDSRQRGGTGLGLAICRTIVEHHNGLIWVASQPGAGSTFSFALPAQHNGCPQTSRPADSEATILVCDDDPAVVDVVQAMLEQRGHHVIAAGSGEQALQLALAERPDAILLDPLMTGVSGWKTLAALKRHPATDDIPIVILSVLAEGADDGRGRSLAARQKPLDDAALSAALTRAPGPHDQPLKVLIVENDFEAAATIRAVFERHGVQTFDAADGGEAIELSQRVAPDMLVLDIGLPATCGLDVIDALRRHERLAALPVVVYTAADRERLPSEEGAQFPSDGRITPQQFEQRVMGLLSRLTQAGTADWSHGTHRHSAGAHATASGPS